MQLYELRGLADRFDNAHRMMIDFYGNKIAVHSTKDSYNNYPEGTQWIELSDTLAREISWKLREILKRSAE